MVWVEILLERPTGREAYWKTLLYYRPLDNYMTNKLHHKMNLMGSNFKLDKFCSPCYICL